MIFVNFKTYRQSTGKNALQLVKVIKEVISETGVSIIPAVQVVDLKEAVGFSKIEIWVQNVDHFEFGPHTGSILPEVVFKAGAAGTFLNHSERRFRNLNELKKTNEIAKKVGLKTLIFSGNIEELKSLVSLKPTYVSYEPPELVGSKELSVAEAKPEVISQAVEITKESRLPLIVGAGIKSFKDVRKSLELGAFGIAVSSDVVKAQNPKKELLELAEGFI